MLAATVETAVPVEAAAGAKTANFENWLPFVRGFRTLCIAPTPGLRLALEQVGRLPTAGIPPQ
jgi:hypothetical protein